MQSVQFSFSNFVLTVELMIEFKESDDLRTIYNSRNLTPNTEEFDCLYKIYTQSMHRFGKKKENTFSPKQCATSYKD
ncbi:CLUMA_CG014884, isoform A [Clunio marinus]|uniref:CLUMA_CG014884, isoform A n=1 Tax=Clunio marinus TaxID=568069 RepID=A0A1J1IRG0_9DIPT|nr:CLUMA_CG014884, isoform A [Clunio marinus]